MAAIVQRITGLGFALVATPALVLMFGPIEGVLVTLSMSLLISLAMLVTVLRDVDWRRSLVLVAAGAVVAAPAAWVTATVAPAWLMIIVGVAALISLVAGRLAGSSGAAVGLRGAAVSGAAAGFLHITSGLSGPPLVIYGLKSAWPQRSFVASLQVIFVAFSLLGLALRGVPQMPPAELGVLAAVVLVGLAVGTVLVRFVPTRIARMAMLAIAWIGTVSVLVRGIVALVQG